MFRLLASADGGRTPPHTRTAGPRPPSLRAAPVRDDIDLVDREVHIQGRRPSRAASLCHSAASVAPRLTTCRCWSYFSSTVAPCSSRVFFSFSASSLVRFSL